MNFLETMDLGNAVLEKTLAGKLRWRRAWFNILGGYKTKVDGFEFHLWLSRNSSARCSVKELGGHGRGGCHLGHGTSQKLWEHLKGWNPVRPIQEAIDAVNKL